MVFLGLKLQENRKKTGRKPKENQKKTGRKPKENRKKTKRKPKENQKKTEENRRKPKENQKKTRRKPEENQKKPTSERHQMALSRGGAEGRTAGPLGFGPHLRPLCGPPQAGNVTWYLSMSEAQRA